VAHLGNSPTGDRTDINNYRPIDLSSNIRRIFVNILKDRVYNTLGPQQPLEQAGFRKGFSTVDHIIMVGQIIKKAKEYNKIVYLVFIVYHQNAWMSLASHSAPRAIIETLHNLYKDSKAYPYIKLDHPSRKFKLRRGVKQGDHPIPKYI